MRCVRREVTFARQVSFAFVIQKYLERHDAPGAVLLSSPPPGGLTRTTLRVARRRPLMFSKICLTFSLSPLIATPELAREAFFSADFPRDELHSYWRLMQDESYMAFVDMVALDHPDPARVKTPLLVLGAGLDNMLSPRDIEATARAYRTTAEIIPRVAHDSMLERNWELVASRILQWLGSGPANVGRAPKQARRPCVIVKSRGPPATGELFRSK